MRVQRHAALWIISFSTDNKEEEFQLSINILPMVKELENRVFQKVSLNILT